MATKQERIQKLLKTITHLENRIALLEQVLTGEQLHEVDKLQAEKYGIKETA